MRRVEALIAFIVAYLMVVSAATWRFGPYGLGAAGIVALVALAFVNHREE